ncbi:MAG: sulfatase [Planctomycetes bacterium]|nr:sulfatase [Planctomycetota bacterium]
MLKLLLSSIICLSLTCSSSLFSSEKSMNVLFIAIDDLNDWIGPMGGNPQVKTPHLDRFAEKSIVMNKAYCAATVCGPSRSSLLTGKACHNTGVYGNENNLKNAPKTKDLETLPEYFGNRGYFTLSVGKIFHKHMTEKGLDEGQWAFHEVAKPKGTVNGMLWEKQAVHPDYKYGGSPMKWGATKASLEKTKDYLNAKWAADQFERDFDDKPFFMALGISRPHLPFFVPQKYFDMYPEDKVKIAPCKMDDHDDILNPDGKPAFKGPDATWLAVDKTDSHLGLNRAYMASVSYADDCLGMLFDALEKSKYADNTIVMLWGDHGWYLGEKLRYRKTGLWEEAARVPFMVRVPGVNEGTKSDGVINLLDMYPTLVELCGLPANPKNDGRSFAKLIHKPQMKWNEPTLTTMGYKNHSLTDGRYRFINYGGGKGAEEFYDHDSDPLEYNNLVRNPEYKDLVARFKALLPKSNEKMTAKNSIGKKSGKKTGKKSGKKSGKK